jgi:hypothetical protein
MKCHRTACNATRDIVCRHTYTNELYCIKCARGINEANPGLVVTPRVDILWRESFNHFVKTGSGSKEFFERLEQDEPMRIMLDINIERQAGILRDIAKTLEKLVRPETPYPGLPEH